MEEKVLCETPTIGKQATRIHKWKYEAVRRAILTAVADKDGVLFKDLPGKVECLLTAKEKKELGSVSWYTTCVKLDLEVKGEIMRKPGTSPQRLFKIIYT